MTGRDDPLRDLAIDEAYRRAMDAPAVGRERDPVDARQHGDDYIDRTIATVRNHRDADNCWPQWANIFADEIEALRAERDALAARVQENNDALDRAYQARDDWKGQAQILAARVAELEAALREERTRHHSLRWTLGLETHEGEEPQSQEDSIRNLLALRAEGGG